MPADIHTLSQGTLLWRIYKRGGPHPTEWNEFRSFGPLKEMRFDHHDPAWPRRRKVLYGAPAIDTCIAEVFQERRVVNRARQHPCLVAIRLARDVPVLNLRQRWPTAAGASMLINSGQRARARRWSVRIYEDYANVEGLWYSSSMNANEPAVMLYERAEDALDARPAFHRALADFTLDGPLHVISARLGYLVVP